MHRSMLFNYSYFFFCILCSNRAGGEKEMEIRNKIQTQCFPLRIDVHHRAANCLRDSREPGKEPDFAMQVTQPRATVPLSVPFSPEIITIPLSLSSQDQKAQTVNCIINHHTSLLNHGLPPRPIRRHWDICSSFLTHSRRRRASGQPEQAGCRRK